MNYLRNINLLTILQIVGYVGDKDVEILPIASSITSKCLNFHLILFSYAGELYVVMHRESTVGGFRTPQHQNLFGVLLFFEIQPTGDQMTNQIKIINTKSFEDNNIDIIEYQGQKWLTASHINKALGYASHNAVTNLYTSNKSEFEDNMSLVVESTTSKNSPNKRIRIFNKRGAWLIAMFARTKQAKNFRKWVLDILESQQKPKIEKSETRSQEQSNNNLINLLGLDPKNPFTVDVIYAMSKSILFLTPDSYNFIINKLLAVINHPDCDYLNRSKLLSAYRQIENSKSDSKINNYQAWESIANKEKRWREKFIQEAKKAYKRLGY